MSSCFRSVQGIFVNSGTTQDRLKHYNGFSSTILPPPLNDPEIFANISTGDYIFAGGRVNAGKRQHLLIEAMKLCRSGVRLIIGGPPDTPADAARLHEAAADARLDGRLELDLGFLERSKLAAYVNNALACAYLPIDEDSVGYVTMEAFQAEKPVITVSDAGGVLEIVNDGTTGLVVEPTPSALAEAMDRLCLERGRTEKLGRAGHDLWASKKCDLAKYRGDVALMKIGWATPLHHASAIGRVSIGVTHALAERGIEVDLLRTESSSSSGRSAGLPSELKIVSLAGMKRLSHAAAI